ncbi:uncharacterized protein L201_003465 [Kwoniella dendrophila CBS 6074]|uniref:CID domain-containing protein n=1 Tax=Kwoniella dendrophila CBS 6074 TaxID=1295534 RepID=A0AAX4JUS1_9TREE
MAELKEFDKLLSSTIQAPRLSGSKVQKLASLASELVSNDHHIVTTFFKLNASLPPASQSRISSLYVFDSISRGLKSDINKGIGTQISKERSKGTQAGLLLKFEGVVDSWIDGLLDDGKGGIWTEGKEKTKKIVDIWTKAGTFPQNCLSRLSKKIADANPQAGPSKIPAILKEVGRSDSNASAGQGSTTPPYPPPSSATPTTQPGSLPPEVAKLLGIVQPPLQASPATDSTDLPNNKSPNGVTSKTIIPNLDLAAILASVNKPQSDQSQAQIQVPTLPNLANLTSILPQNVIPPSTSHQNQGSPLQYQNPFPQAGPSNLNANLPLNPAAAALNKFAILAQNGPAPPTLPPFPPTSQGQSRPAPPYNGQGSGFNGRSPQRGFNDLPPPPEGLKGDFTRNVGNFNPPHNSPFPPQNQDGRSFSSNSGYQGPPNQGLGNGHGRRQSGDNGWGRRGSYENDNFGSRGLPGPSGGPGDGNRNRSGRRNGGRDRERSRSPNRYQGRFERQSDNGWGSRSQRNNVNHEGAFNNDNDNNHNIGSGRMGEGSRFGNDQFSNNNQNNGTNYNHNNQYPARSLQPQLPPSAQVQPYQNGSTIPSNTNNGLPPIPMNSGLPPKPVTNLDSMASQVSKSLPVNDDHQGNNVNGNNGRAPPPAWMDERSDDTKYINENRSSDNQNNVDTSGLKAHEEEAGEEDMKLVESDNENQGISGGGSKNQNKNVNQIQHRKYIDEYNNDYNYNYNNNNNDQQSQNQNNNEYNQQQQHQQQQHQQQQYTEMITLDKFPIKEFNPSLPEHWTNLAQAWKNSFGKDPNQFELMTFLAAPSMSMNGGESGGGGGGGMGMMMNNGGE